MNEGFVYIGAGSCADCRAGVLWYRTPKGKCMPIDAAKKVPHFWTCSALEDRGRRGSAVQLGLFTAHHAPSQPSE